MFVFVCWTPYQVFNAMNFVINNVEESQNDSDIYIYHQFHGSELVSKKLREANIFCHVHDVDVYHEKKAWYSKFNKIKLLMFPKSNIKKYVHGKVDFSNRNYKTLVISGNNLFGINLYNVVKNMSVYFIDDGLGSYYGDMRADYMTWSYKLFNKIFHRGPLSYKIEKIYINNKEMCRTKLCAQLIQLPSLLNNIQVIELLKFVFSYQTNKIYEAHKVIYLSQPYSEIKEYRSNAQEAVLEKIGNMGLENNSVLRLHPRENEDDFQQWNLDKFRNLWELECVEQIADNNILIGGFSTAQFMPKILGDKEPFIIFLYKILFTNGNASDREEVVDVLKNSYKNPEKIFVPDNIDELGAILNRIFKV
ncbi:MAG: hypothetical protein EOM11_05850 [Erysipelotrichia bacterium]|nr:hypothetical protein [Erysipelotrichia bacterium]